MLFPGSKEEEPWTISKIQTNLSLVLKVFDPAKNENTIWMFLKLEAESLFLMPESVIVVI